jgi:hypothetical protein
MNGITWEDPPRTKPRNDWGKIAETLRANPGKWAVIETASTAYCAFIRQGRTKAFQPAGSFEATLQNHKLYARYIGVEPQPQTKEATS